MNRREKVEGSLLSNEGFYIGDICYVLSQDHYRYWDQEHDFENGIFTPPESDFSFGVASTAYGDGTQKDNDGGVYAVDAGNIGVVPMELVEKPEWMKLGRYVPGKGTAQFCAEDGVFRITLPGGLVLNIDTRTEPDV